MCNKCFNEEFYGFSSQSIFEKIWNELKSKLSNDKLIQLSDFEGYFSKPFIRLGTFSLGSKSFNGCKVYQCKYCSQIWNLAYPENAFRGFLLKEENYLKSESPKKRFWRIAKGFYVLVLIV